MASPLATLTGLLWASSALWPPSALIPLLAARTAVLLAGLPHPRAEHQELQPDHDTLRTLAGVARRELLAHPDLAAALERLVEACEEAAWWGTTILPTRALLAQWREAQDGAVLDAEAAL